MLLTAEMQVVYTVLVRRLSTTNTEIEELHSLRSNIFDGLLFTNRAKQIVYVASRFYRWDLGIVSTRNTSDYTTNYKPAVS